MKLALFSDVHGNLPALEAVLADAERANVEGHVCLGDIADLGPRPNEVLARIRALGCPIVQGNHDPFDGALVVPPLVPVTKWCEAELEEDGHTFLRQLPPSVSLSLAANVSLLFVHGSPKSYDDQIFPDTTDAELEAYLEGVTADVVVCGHTHVQLARRLKRQMIVNVGSVGMPFESAFSGGPPTILPWAEYAIFCVEDGRVSFDLRRVGYDFEAFSADVRESGFPNPEAWLAQWAQPADGLR